MKKIILSLFCIGFIIAALVFEERGLALALPDLLFWSVYGILGIIWFTFVGRYFRKKELDVGFGVVLLIIAFGLLWPMIVLLWLWANDFCSRMLGKYFPRQDWHRPCGKDSGRAVSDEEKIEAMKRLLEKE